MKSYIQYKQFNNVDELNEWLKTFCSTERDDGKGSPFGNFDHDSMVTRTLMSVQFLQAASISGDNVKVDGSIGVFPIAQFKVTVSE